MDNAVVFLCGMGAGLLIGFVAGFVAALVVEKMGIRVKVCW